MAKTMKAAGVRECDKPLVIEDAPIPTVGPGQILVKIAATGVCHTDLHAAEGDWPVKPNPPFIPGHEGVGHVAAVGAGVTHVKEGDRVGVPWLYTACGHCVPCLGGWEPLCESQLNSGSNGLPRRLLPQMYLHPEVVAVAALDGAADRLLIGMDLHKARAVLERAYAAAQGITAATIDGGDCCSP